MLGTEPTIVENHVVNGEVLYVFWPVINHGQPSFDATLVMECAGQQSPELAWEAHRILFENLSDLYRPSLDLYLSIAEEAGADLEQFRNCFASQEAIDQVAKLDQIRRDRGIAGQPIFDINGLGYLAGAQPYEVFADVLQQVANQ